MVTKIDKFSIAFRPLTVTSSIEIVQASDDDSDGSPAVQVYDVLGGGYYPDYTVFPLVLQPRVDAYDPDGKLGDGLINVTKDVANMKWYVIANGTKELIQNNGTNYEFEPSGDNKGRLKVKRNIPADFPITLIYEADYLDTRTGAVHPIRMTQIVRSEIAQIKTKLSLDVPSQVFYNPYEKDNNNQPITNKVVHASIFSGNTSVNAGMCKCIWQISKDDGVNWADFGSDPTNLFGEVSEDTMSLDINMEFMGDEIVVACHACANASPTALADMTKDDAFESASFKVTRKLPRYTAGMFRFPHKIGIGQKTINPKAQIDFTNFMTDNPEQELLVSWETRKRIEGQSFKKVGLGLSPTIPVETLVSSVPQEVKLEVKDRGTWKLLTDGAGNYLTDGSGKYLMIR